MSQFIPRLLHNLRQIAEGLRAPARKVERRARLQVEALEEKVVPSTTAVPLAKFNGTYKVSFSGKVPVKAGGHFLVKASYGIQIKNGVITDIGAKGGGRLLRTGALNANASFRGIYIKLQGKGILTQGKPTAKGSWIGTYLGQPGTGTWFAAPFRIPSGIK